MNQSGWIAKRDYSGHTPEDMRARGWKLLGRGGIPNGVEVTYAWTGTKSPGFAGKLEKYWIGRWIRSVAK